MECPNCKLICPPDAILCDCGYSFQSRKYPVEIRPPSHNPWPAPRNVFLSLWFFWVAITAAYLVTIEGSGNRGYWSYSVNAILGFFTPMGYMNLGASLEGARGIITIPAMIAGLILGDLVGRKISRLLLRALYNLAVLALLTMVVDVVIWEEWKSWKQLREIFN